MKPIAWGLGRTVLAVPGIALLRGAVAVIAGTIALGAAGCSAQSRPAGEDVASPRVVLSAPGRVEGASETVEIGAAMDGVVAEVHVEEGAWVESGTLLVSLDCADQRAAFDAARAEHRRSVETRRRLLRGAREEERRAAAAEAAASAAALERARKRHERLRRLVETEELIARDEFDEAVRDLAVAESEYEAASQRARLVEAGPLPEEVARADAEVEAGASIAREWEARFEKCRITAPDAGRILRVHRRPGEQVSLAFPGPIVSMADTSMMRVRAEIDERDVGRVREGQAARITADAFGGRALEGRVAWLARIMGRKNVRSGDPAEKSDRDVLEVVVDLAGSDPALVVGLRVTTEFLGE